MADDNTSVRVAVRIRPQSAKEKIDAYRVCTFVTPGEAQLSIGKDKRFTYDYVFDIPTQQKAIYDSCVEKLVEGCFEGYNATVLAYGQTGSGKTYTMGTGFDVSRTREEFGVIPRAVEQLFNGIDTRKSKASDEGLPEPEFIISAQFMEIYNEDIIDLFDSSRGAHRTQKIQIQGDTSGNIYAVGVTSKVVRSSEELMKCLQDGALNRTTASTRMNAQSSRSHAIFTIHMKQTRAVRSKTEAESPTSEDNDSGVEVPKENGVMNGDGPLEYETLSAKFHFTDLAGSERLKRTGATGDRAKEGININCGLLALGNVISALGDPAKAGSHVPYRDSKLTRLLQDSLGGNSRTLMIACVSPSDSDFMETISTLTYANRARNIKNKVVLNQDKASQQMQVMRQQIAALQMELTEYKMGKRVAGEECYNDMYQENNLLREENEHLRMRVKAMQEKSNIQMDELTKMKAKQVMGRLEQNGDGDGDNEDGGGMESIIENYIKENETLRLKLLESESMCENLRKRSTSLSCAPMSPFASRVTPTPMPMAGTSVFESPSAIMEIPVLDLAKKDVEGLRQKRLDMENHTLLGRENKENEAENGHKADADEEDDNDDDTDESDADLNLSDSEDEDEEAVKDEKKKEDDNMQNELAALTFEIDLKQNLIDELEAQKKRMESLRHQYESKVKQLEIKIRSTEEERDKILSNFDPKSAGGGDQKKIKADYEKKLDNMKKEVGKLKQAKKSHDKMLREQTRHQQQLKKLKYELEQMKTNKVRLMKQMKEQQKKGKQQETQRLRVISQLQKEGRKKDSQLRTLESKFQAKDRIVRRNKEEIEMLRKQIRPISGKVGVRKVSSLIQETKNTRIPRDKKHTRKQSSEYSSKMAKAKWLKLEKKISNVVMQRETIVHMEKQMDRLMKQREQLQRDIQRSERKKTKLKATRSEIPPELVSELENFHEAVEFTNNQIEEIQSEILQVTESMESDSFMSSLFATCTMNEYRYFLDHILTVVINKSAMALVSQNRIAELEAKLEGELETSKQAQELMRYIVEERSQYDPEITELIKSSAFDEGDDSDDSSPERPSSSNGFLPNLPLPKDTKVKARRKTATPQELLHGVMKPETNELKTVLSPIISEESPAPNGPMNMTFDVEALNGPKVDTSTPGENDNAKSRRLTYMIKPEPPVTLPLNETYCIDSPINPSPNLENPVLKITPSPVKSPHKVSPSDEFSQPTTPPSSRPQSSKNQNLPHDVFARLTKFSLASPRINRGRMKECPSKATTPRSSPLEPVQVAEHTKPVLCLHATEHLLFSGSKDRTVKVWNLVTGQEFETLDGHPNNVNVVHRCAMTGLVYTVSLCYIKVWDIRSKAKCIKIISSTGQLRSPSSFLGTMSRTNRMPDNEAEIVDLALSKDSKLLYIAAGSAVKIWDLSRNSMVGKLTGHTGQVKALEVPNVKTETVITGSKDHYVKSFQIPDALGSISPTTTFKPPHMDGVEAITTSLTHNALFSGSRDKSIKKWELDSKNLIKSEYLAHTSWVCTLDVVNFGQEEMLVSGGRDGVLKLWDIESLSVLGEIRAHTDTINHVASNKDFIYTASNDATVKVWRPR